MKSPSSKPLNDQYAQPSDGSRAQQVGDDAEDNDRQLHS
jgi:hypothetical protein